MPFGEAVKYDPFSEQGDKYSWGEPVDFDPFEQEEEALTALPIPQKEKAGVQISDYPKAIAKGVGTALKSIGGIGRHLDPKFVMGLTTELAGEMVGSEDLRVVGEQIKAGAGSQQAIGLGEQAEEYWEESYSPSMKAERAKPFISEDPQTAEEIALGKEPSKRAGPGVRSVHKIASMVAESGPISILGMGGGAAITRGMLIGGTKILGKVVSREMAGVIGGAIGEGFTAGSINSQEAYKQIESTSDEKLSKMPAYQEVMSNLPEGMTDKAKKRLAKTFF